MYDHDDAALIAAFREARLNGDRALMLTLVHDLARKQIKPLPDRSAVIECGDIWGTHLQPIHAGTVRLPYFPASCDTEREWEVVSDLN